MLSFISNLKDNQRKILQTFCASLKCVHGAYCALQRPTQVTKKIIFLFDEYTLLMLEVQPQACPWIFLNKCNKV